MGDKLTNNDFLNCFNKNDFIILTETWRNKSFSLPDFEIISNPATKYQSKTQGRCSGGVVFGFKTCFKREVKLILTRKNYIWCKLDRKLFNIERDLFICAIYIPPRDSPYFDADVFVEHETDIALFSSEGFVLIAGDLNSRTGCGLDYYDEETSTFENDAFTLPNYAIKTRKNFDNIINEHGKGLLEICKSCDLRILNGRTKGDSFGKITYHSAKGISVVDYIIASQEMLHLVENLIVKQPTIYSDHSQIICWLKTTQPKSNRPSENNSQVKTEDLPKQFICMGHKFKRELSHGPKLTEIQTKIRNFKEKEFEHSCKGVDLAKEEFTYILNKASLRSLKLVTNKKKRKKHSSQK